MSVTDQQTSTAPAAALSPVVIEAWADIICPWCYVGEARLLRAARESGVEVELVPRAFELDPHHGEPEPVLDMLASKYGAAPGQAAAMDDRVAGLARAEGLPYTSERMTANTFDAHRLIAGAAREGLGMDVRHAIQRGYFAGELDLADADALVAAAVSAGMDAVRAASVLDSDAEADAVRHDEAEARRLGATGVPFSVLAGRYAVPGCAEVDQYAEAIRRAGGLSRSEP